MGTLIEIYYIFVIFELSNHPMKQIENELFHILTHQAYVLVAYLAMNFLLYFIERFCFWGIFNAIRIC